MRRTPLKRRRSTPRRSGRVRDVEYMLLVKQLPCVFHASHPAACEGPVEADHAGRRPLGRKANDDTCIPLCRSHHRDRTDARNFFAGISAPLMRRWCDRMIAQTQDAVRLLRERGELIEDGVFSW